jgi:hypothetical protein
MRHLIAACCLLLASLSIHAQDGAKQDAVKAKVSAFIDEWHDDAAHARLAYFDKMAKDGVYIGTDKTELWTREQFREWARPYFERKSAWAFKAIKRNVYMTPDAKTIWFDELLDTRMGVCQASGVIANTGKAFEIKHYQLSMAVPNEVGAAVTKLIKEHEARPAAAK